MAERDTQYSDMLDQQGLLQTTPESFLPQKDGLVLLSKVLMKQVPVRELQPFVLDLRPQLSRRQAQFSLGRINEESGNSIYLSFTPASFPDGRYPSELLVTPAISEIGEQPYYWLDFSDSQILGISDVARRPLVSCRLQPDEPVQKIDFRHWRNLGEQLLVDFINQENGIGFQQLRPFPITVDSPTSPYPLGAQERLSLRKLNSGFTGIEGEKFQVVPQSDERGIYHWIEVLRENQDFPERPQRVSTYRIFRDEKKLVGLGAEPFVPERQLLIDYVDGEQEITFLNLRSVRVDLPEKFGHMYLGKGKKQYSISVPTREVAGCNETVLIPRQDGKGLYQWLELYRFAPESLVPVGEQMTSIRIIRNEGFEGGWIGPERQSLIDYTEGTNQFSDLMPLPIMVGKSLKVIDLWSREGKKLYLVPSAVFDLKSGDKLTLVPDKESNGVAFFQLFRGKDILGIYSLNRETLKLVREEIFDQRNLPLDPRTLLVDYAFGKISFLDLQTLILKVGKNTQFVHVIGTADYRIHVSPAKSFNLQTDDEVRLVPEEEVEGVAVFQFQLRGQTLGRYSFYKDTLHFLRYIKESRIKKRAAQANEEQAISSHEADAMMRGLLEEEV